MGIIDKLNKDFESRVRLGIMSVLMVNDWIYFTEMKTLLNITDGNLASHASALEKAEYIEIKKEFVQATCRAANAGFDWLELHCAHGYLLSAFISPLTNKRSDEYGGSLENRLRWPLEIFKAMREVWPEHLPMSVRISAHDWVDGGITPTDAVEIAKAFNAAGADMIDCSSGQVSVHEKPVYGRMFQTPLADQIRQELLVRGIVLEDKPGGITLWRRA